MTHQNVQSKIMTKDDVIENRRRLPILQSRKATVQCVLYDSDFELLKITMTMLTMRELQKEALRTHSYPISFSP